MAGVTAAVSAMPSVFQINEVTNTTQQALHNASISDFVIIEYQDRIGGRAQHTTFGKQKDGSPYTIELGANWVRCQSSPLVDAADLCRSKDWASPAGQRTPCGRL